MARPPLPAAERRSEVLQVRLTKKERAAMDRAAKVAGITVTDLLRGVALEAAARLLAKK